MKAITGEKYRIKQVIGGAECRVIYEVYDIHGEGSAVPNTDGATIFLQIAERTPLLAPAFLTLPIGKFIEVASHIGKQDAD